MGGAFIEKIHNTYGYNVHFVEKNYKKYFFINFVGLYLQENNIL